MKFAFLLFLILAPQVRVVEPVRVAILTQGEAPHAAELERLIRAELQKPELRGAVRIVSYGAQYDLYFTVAELDGVGCAGFVASMTVKDMRRPSGPPTQSLRTAASLESLAAKLAKKLEKEYFTKRRQSER